MPIDTPPLLGGSQATQSLKAREPISSAQNTAVIPGIAEERGRCHAQGHDESQKGQRMWKKKGSHSRRRTLDQCHNKAKSSTTICKAVCAEQSTSIDTKQKRRICPSRHYRILEGSRIIGGSVQNATRHPPERTRLGLYTPGRKCYFPT